MIRYKIEIAQPAVRDLQDILDYIANTLKEPAIAQRIYTSIKKEILTLSSMPERNRVVDDEPYAAFPRPNAKPQYVFFRDEISGRIVRVHERQCGYSLVGKIFHQVISRV